MVPSGTKLTIQSWDVLISVCTSHPHESSIIANICQTKQFRLVAAISKELDKKCNENHKLFPERGEKTPKIVSKVTGDFTVWILHQGTHPSLTWQDSQAEDIIGLSHV